MLRVIMPGQEVEFWLDISKIWLDKFSGPSMMYDASSYSYVIAS